MDVPSTSPPRLLRVTPAMIALATLAVLVLVCGIAFGPGDLYEKDQPKTAAYTVDIVRNGRWALPRDVLFQPATKPPFYNWVGAIAVFLTGSTRETILKLPSILGAIASMVAIAWIAMRQRDDDARLAPRRAAQWPVIALLGAVGFASVGIDTRTSVLRLLYVARPDMLLSAFLTVGWASATAVFIRARRQRLAADELPRAGVALPILFWACFAGAALTKGPMAVLLPIFAVPAARFVGGAWRDALLLRPLVGLPAALACVGLWLWRADASDSSHVREVMLAAEMVNRIVEHSPEGESREIQAPLVWFFEKGGPQAYLAAVLAIVALVERRRRRAEYAVAPTDAYAPRGPAPVTVSAAIWLFLVLAANCLSKGKRIDYLQPAYAAVGLLAADVLVAACVALRASAAWAFVVVLGLACAMSYSRLTNFREGKVHWTDRAAAFVAQAKQRVADDDPLVVIIRGRHVVATLMGRHPGAAIGDAELRTARWAMLPTALTTATPVIVSEPIPVGFEMNGSMRTVEPVGLYDLRGAAPPTLAELRAAQRDVGRWTFDDNPYGRRPGTVYPDDEE